ncbi:MAG: hypothetical protein ACFB01_01970 [Cohaesibacteraceae bacterium]
MSGVVMLGVLSGMVFGAMGMLVRRIAGFVIVLPILVTPIAYLYIWRDVINGPCLFADTFRTALCTPTREFVFMTVSLAEDAMKVSTSHLLVGFGVVLVLTVFRAIIDAVDFSGGRQGRFIIPRRRGASVAGKTKRGRSSGKGGVRTTRKGSPAVRGTEPGQPGFHPGVELLPSFVDGPRETAGFMVGETGSVVVPFSPKTVEALAAGQLPESAKLPDAPSTEQSEKAWENNQVWRSGARQKRRQR